MDKSATHFRVQKNGIEDTMPKNVWNAIGGTDNKDGWVLIQDSPPEAIEIRRKLTEPVLEEVVTETAVEKVVVKAKNKK